ncbi:hypothetical protein DVH05_000300 [Phytophthora capsici]|nr:hypothetical protein DVH05_000300 [Phytophthora capsici]
MAKTTKSPKKLSKSTKKPASSHSSQQRATWAVNEEFDLLDMYCEARKDASLTTDKGLKAKAWRTLTDALNTKHGRSLDKAQYKAKKDRIMRDYDLF